MMSWLNKFLFNRKRGENNAERRLPEGVYCNAVPVPAADDAAEWLRIVPVGQFLDHWQGPYEVKPEHIAQMAANFDASHTDLLVSIDHDFFFGGGSSRAAGWIAELDAREDGLYARPPEWTPFGEELVANREYRYFSPEFRLDSTDRKNQDAGAEIVGVALTNYPYFRNHEIDPVGNSDRPPSEQKPPNIMDREKLISKLGLGADATDEQIEQAIGELQEKATVPETETETEPVAETETETEVEVGGDSADVKVEQLEAKVNSLEKLIADREKADQEGRAEALVNQAISDRKILPRDKETYLRSAKADFAATKTELDGIAVNSVKPGSVQVNAGGANNELESRFARTRDPKYMEYVNSALPK